LTNFSNYEIFFSERETDAMTEKPRSWTLPAKEVIETQKRVLRLLHKYMRANLDDRTLVAAGGGLMTWGELRMHVREAAALKVKREKRP
jgi:hypothetical protein